VGSIPITLSDYGWSTAVARDPPFGAGINSYSTIGKARAEQAGLRAVGMRLIQRPAAPGRQGGLQLLVYQLGVLLLCTGEQQEPVAVQQLARTDKTGEPVAADNVWAQASPGQAGLPSASCVAAAPSRPVSQA
jgi:hypothetical protein